MKTTAYFEAIRRRPDRAGIHNEWIQRAVESPIRDRHARQLPGKTEAEIIAFYRAAGEAAMEDLRQRSKPRKRRAG